MFSSRQRALSIDTVYRPRKGKRMNNRYFVTSAQFIPVARQHNSITTTRPGTSNDIHDWVVGVTWTTQDISWVQDFIIDKKEA